ncbi:hypothetical protein COV18_02435 [Candidatus Woesearchaeota archaeon CG10_big_fil_rev_8_21_14_0_10_37_12]|nr:MAG: hypothetical protein COV18_02435 [Candidatus Woesearchaeota archaeon CG10_big_fil_rev_8_21_14_0_10_37_12]
MILDTTFLIDLLKNKKEAILKARELELTEAHLATTTISVFELWRGLDDLSIEKKEKACNFLDQLTIYPLNLIAAKKGGEIANKLDSKGQEIDPEDCMIAGIALEHTETILTRNTKHFKRIPNLFVESY